MLRNKVTKKISELQNEYTPTGIDCMTITEGFKALKLGKSSSEFKKFKSRGYGFEMVFMQMLAMVLNSHKTVNGYMTSFMGLCITMGKDVFYRIKNNSANNWRMLLWQISTRFINVTGQDSVITGKPCCLIFDDTTLEKTGKKIEFIGRVWEHVKQRSVLGFKLLLMLYWDGVSAIPLDFSIHREKGSRAEKPFGMSKKELRRQYSKKRIRESAMEKRIDELDKSKIEMCIKMFYCAVYHCLKIDYVLVDSWFTCEAFIHAVRSVKGQTIHLIGMYKFVKTKFTFAGCLLTHGEINRRLGNPHRCRSLGYQYKRAEVMLNGVSVLLYFSRRGKRDKWKVLLTTDTALSFKQVVEQYQVRWTIEVFNKEAKSLLNLGGCQSSNFDAQIADTTIIMIAHILLSLRYRYRHYESMGALFRTIEAENINLTLDRRIWALFVELLQVIAEVFEIDVEELLGKVIANPEAANLIENLLFSSHWKDS